jgi:hypothetical protein
MRDALSDERAGLSFVRVIAIYMHYGLSVANMYVVFILQGARSNVVG